MPRPTLLVADPDPRSLRILELALRKAGFAVETAQDGARALERILSSPPELVVCEASLPSLDGIAVCRVARETPVSIMFPLVSTLDELLQAWRALQAAAGGTLPTGLEVGIMVEVPAVALKAAAFLPHLDFLSIGTNDLTQYALAADRGNDAVASLSDALDPGVLGLVGEVCAAAQGRASVAVCGEAAADPLAVPVLLGLGVRVLSVSPPSVPAVKAGVRELRLTGCTALAREARGMGTAGEVRQAAAGLLAGVGRDGA